MTDYCVICGTRLELMYDSNYDDYTYFRCDFHNMPYMRRNKYDTWLHLENRPWEDDYGAWLDCTKKIRAMRREIVIFT